MELALFTVGAKESTDALFEEVNNLYNQFNNDKDLISGIVQAETVTNYEVQSIEQQKNINESEELLVNVNEMNDSEDNTSDLNRNLLINGDAEDGVNGWIDLAIDARHLGKAPNSEELSIYNTDIAIKQAIDDDDLLEIARQMLLNPEYTFNS